MLTKDQLKAARESERLANEAKFEAAILDYITQQQRYRFGGVVNALGTLSSICRDLALKHRCDDYETAADIIDGINEACNLPYYHQDEE